ncbi:hypothetical protein Q1695_003151 [Nippostrongylus brasiliensis]|nr:hypothetical protein Q1695_003151 [Nippostrongylus brasiliensis]
MARLPSDFLSFDQEPKSHARTGPPPAYRSASGTVTETDTWSEYSGSSGLGKRRASWVNLVESDENLNKHKVNCYPKVKQPNAQHISSRAPSQLAFVSDNYQFHLMNSSCQALPVKAPVPAGTLPPSSAMQSRAPSVVMPPSAALQPKAQPLPEKKRNRLQEMKKVCLRPCCIIIVVLLHLAVISGVIAAIVLSQVLKAPKETHISWLAPEMYRNGQNQPVSIDMKADDEQVRFQMQGALPFKGNYISYYDFKTNRVAVIDETLKSNSKTCFVMPLDRSNLRDAETMRKAAGAASHKLSQTQGWDESWQYLPSPMTANGQQMFNPPIPECEGARWIQIDYSGTNQKNRKCSDCYDFCLPDYGIEKDTVRGSEHLNIVKRVCFYLFVPEWRTYAQANTIEQNQRDFETYYRNRNHLNTAYGSNNGGSDSKWITLQQLPQAIQNVTGNLAGQMGNTVNGMVNTAGDMANGLQVGAFGRSNYGQSQPNYQNNNGRNGQMQPNPSANGFAPAAVNGVVNMNGVNGRNDNTAYNMANNNQASYTNMEAGYPNDPNGLHPANQQPSISMTGYQPDIRTDIQMKQGNSNVPGGYQHQGNQQGNPNQYGIQDRTLDQRDANVVSNTNGNGFAAQGYNGRSPYPDANGVNPPAGYVPQSGTPIQGIAGMHIPSSAAQSNTGYKPDIAPNPQYQQQQPQQQYQLQQQQQQQQPQNEQQFIPHQRWIRT